MLDRKTEPAFNPLKKVSIPEVNKATLSNGTNLTYLNHESTSVFKIELVIRAGSWYTSDYHLVPLTLKMLNEGTLQKSGKQVAEAFDKLGSFIELVPGFDNSSLVIYGLSKYLESNLEILSEILLEPAFELNTFTNLKEREAQKLELNLEKSSYKASTIHRSNLFGNKHPYGVIASPGELRNSSLEAIKTFYNTRFKDFDILISGNLPSNYHSLLDKFFGHHVLPEFPKANQSFELLNGEHRIEERNSKFVQSSIRVGRALFNRSHPDYIDFMVLNEVLGGYFGSRLMKNIREEKGFTYGIYSQLYALNHKGFFTIATDVNSDNENETISEILLEIQTLRTESISTEELNTVKNYMAGTFAGSLGTPFSLMDKFKAVHYQGLDLKFYNQYLDSINSITPDRLQSLANQYLQEQDLSLAIVGS